MSEIGIRSSELHTSLAQIGQGFATGGNSLRVGGYNSTMQSVSHQFNITEQMANILQQYHSILAREMGSSIVLTQTYETQDRGLRSSIINAIPTAVRSIALNAINAATTGGDS